MAPIDGLGKSPFIDTDPKEDEGVAAPPPPAAAPDGPSATPTEPKGPGGDAKGYEHDMGASMLQSSLVCEPQLLSMSDTMPTDYTESVIAGLIDDEDASSAVVHLDSLRRGRHCETDHLDQAIAAMATHDVDGDSVTDPEDETQLEALVDQLLEADNRSHFDAFVGIRGAVGEVARSRIDQDLADVAQERLRAAADAGESAEVNRLLGQLPQEIAASVVHHMAGHDTDGDAVAADSDDATQLDEHLETMLDEDDPAEFETFREQLVERLPAGARREVAAAAGRKVEDLLRENSETRDFTFGDGLARFASLALGPLGPGVVHAADQADEESDVEENLATISRIMQGPLGNDVYSWMSTPDATNADLRPRMKDAEGNTQLDGNLLFRNFLIGSERTLAGAEMARSENETQAWALLQDLGPREAAFAVTDLMNAALEVQEDTTFLEDLISLVDVKLEAKLKRESGALEASAGVSFSLQDLAEHFDRIGDADVRRMTDRVIADLFVYRGVAADPAVKDPNNWSAEQWSQFRGALDGLRAIPRASSGGRPQGAGGAGGG